jgi:DNA uptake protein ComE-like DNA-binding protein
MKKSVAGIFLGMLVLLLAATGSFAVPDEGTSSAETTKTVTKKVRKKTAATTNLVDINSASPDQLATLPGITGEDAKKIIASRPYTRKNQLKQKNIIAAATYDGIKNLIVAKRQKNL